MYLLLPIWVLFSSLLPLQGGLASTEAGPIEEAVEALLANRYEQLSVDFEVRLVRTGGEIDPDKPFTVTLPASDEVPRALARIEVRHDAHRSGEKTSGEGWALIYIAHFDSVAMITRPARKDEPIRPGDVRFVWTDITRFRGHPMAPGRFRRLAAHGDVFADRFLSENRLLRADDLRNAYAVTTGQSVRMYYQRRRMVLELQCKARSPGFAGDTIKLFSPDTQRMYRARITGSGQADWLETLE